MKLSKTKKLLFFITIIFYSLSFSKCMRENHQHKAAIVCRCIYTQQDIERALEEQKDRYKQCCKEKKCFYCQCPISEHTQ